MSRYDVILDGAARWGAWYRKHPDKFAEEYLHIKLRTFQRVLLVMMFWSTTFVLIACRGLGKTYLSAIYCIARCILYPGTRVCIASGTRGQAVNVLEKILYELRPVSEELRAEIDDKETKVNGTNAQVVFHNTSMIKVVTASDSARGNRCHVLLLDEFRLINKDTIDTVLRKFLTLKRMPRYEDLTDEQRRIEYEKEKNLTMYLSSAYFKDHWSYTKCVDTFKAMIDPDRHQFVCAFPYQLSIKEGLLDPEVVQDEMSEADFSAIKFGMEMEALFYGSADGAFFDFDSISKNRRIRYPMLPERVAKILPAPQAVRIPPKNPGEVRLLSADIALMSSRRHANDATAVFVNQMVPTKAGRYLSNITYASSYEGLRTEEQALIIRKMYDEFMCDYIVLDTNGIGLGVFDCLARDIVDPDTGDIYPALSCCNNREMADRCTSSNADRVIWSIKAGAQFNSDCAYALREGFRSGRIRLLANEYDADAYLGEIKGFNTLDDRDKLALRMPYIQTTLLIDELVNLQHEESGGKIKIQEKSGSRKDRYSSLSYNYYVAMQLDSRLGRSLASDVSGEEKFIIRAPGQNGRTVKTKHDESGYYEW